MKAILTQRIHINNGVLEPGTVVEINFYEKPRGSYRSSHRTPYVASYQRIEFRLSSNSFKWIEGEQNV